MSLLEPGLYTIELIQQKRNCTKQSAINLVSRLKKQKLITLIKGSKKRLYKISDKPIEVTQGMYTILNKTPIKLQEHVAHYTTGKKISVEQTIADALEQKQVRYQMAVVFLINKITNWTTLFEKLRKKKLEQDFMYCYHIARQSMKTQTIPARYENIKSSQLQFTKKDIKEVKND
jgi:K+ transporter